MKWILTNQDAATPQLMGGKAAALAELSSHSLPIPPWFVISPEAFDASLSEAQRIDLHSAADPAILQQLVSSLRPTGEIARAIEQAAAELSKDEGFLAVRSSAVDEDGADHSFAGQLESFLFVPAGEVARRVAEVWRSGFADRVFRYRLEHGMKALPSPPAVLVQRMIDADVSGVAFAADPITGGRSTIVISAVFGLGTALVGGEADGDTYWLKRDGRLLEQKIVRKTLRHVPDSSQLQGVRAESVDDAEAARPTLDPGQLQQIVELVLSVSRLRRRPQDIEWAIQAGRVYLLQARPITALATLADSDGVRAIWDNSNIAESYSGITTPLTFTFARRAYDGAYRQFCRLMKVPARVIEENDAIFPQMLGLIRGRVYYNLLNWYRLLAMLPGYSVNRQFMEQMMGVREGIPAELAGEVSRSRWSRRQADRLRLAWSAAGLLWNHLVLERKIRAFYARLEQAMAPPEPPLRDMRLDQLAAEFRKLESRLVTRWDAPLINDFLAMIFFGVLGKLCKTWCASVTENLQNDLIADEGGMISTEPARRIAEMATLIVNDEPFVNDLCDGDIAALDGKIRQSAAFDNAYRAYLEKFGDRCLEELKLESSTLVDDPTPLLRSIGHTALRLRDPSSPAQAFRPRQSAEARVAEALRHHPLRRFIFAWVLHHARGRVRDRENLRFERTRLFGRVRRIFIEIGRRWRDEARLENERDIFHLTLDEILALNDGASVLENVRDLAKLRKKQFDEYRALPVPAERFETRGPVCLGNRFEALVKPAAAGRGEALAGIGCCPGIVRGPVRVIREPRGAQLKHGEILVAERTDPGWIMLLPAAAGILVERGSLLSHSAIVAREMGIPAVVSIPGLTQSLTDGQWVEMNGTLGTVHRISPMVQPELERAVAIP
jgi:phosphohistidine swiveling domain-containing protein